VNQYRKDIEKLYERIIKIVSKGESYLQNYYDLIDEVIEYGKSGMLQDVMYTKFKIDTRTYKSIDDLKKTTFKKISNFTESQANKNLQSLFLSKGVYTLGTQFFDLTSTKYLGDIKQYNTSTTSDILDVITFYPEYLRVAIPKFISSPLMTLVYKKDSIVYYGDKLFQCVKEYTWSKENRITPTFSNYWVGVYPGTASFHTVDNQNISLIDRYSTSIDILREYYFIEYSSNNYTEPNYIDEYFE
jgi:hypothetical protein